MFYVYILQVGYVKITIVTCQIVFYDLHLISIEVLYIRNIFVLYSVALSFKN